MIIKDFDVVHVMRCEDIEYLNSRKDFEQSFSKLWNSRTYLCSKVFGNDCVEHVLMYVVMCTYIVIISLYFK